MCVCFFFQAEDGIRDAQESRGLGDVYKRQSYDPATSPAGLNQLVARAAGVPDIRAAHSLVNDTQVRIAGLFDELIGPVG